MKTLCDAGVLIAESDVLEIGCGGDHGSIPALTRQGVPALGVDLEPDATNQDLILTELELKFQAGGLSCYPYYPDGISTVWDAVKFLESQITAEDIVPAVKFFIDEVVKVQSQAENMEFRPSYSASALCADRVVKADAQQVLGFAGEERFGTVYAENFLHNFAPEKIKDWADLVNSRLRPGGKLIVVQRIDDNIGATIGAVTASGLAQVESAPLDEQTRLLTSLRTRQLIACAMSDIPYRLVYQKV